MCVTNTLINLRHLEVLRWCTSNSFYVIVCFTFFVYEICDIHLFASTRLSFVDMDTILTVTSKTWT